MGLMNRAVEKAAVYVLGKQFNVATISGAEKERSLSYIIRRHYADPDQGDNGRTRCPLYYGSIEGIGGSTSQTIAKLKVLPKPGADETFRMISEFNVIPKMVQTDLSCLVNDFSWDRLEVLDGGTKSEGLTELAQAILKQAEQDGAWTIRELLQQSAAAGDGYTRIKPDPTLDPGVRLETALAEGVFPEFEEWQANRPRSYRSIHKLLPSSGGTDAAASPVQLGDLDTYCERVDAEKVEVWKNSRLIPEMSGAHPAGLDEIPMVHSPYRVSSRFFGVPCADSGIVDAVDELNRQGANLDNVLDGYGHPILLLIGLTEPPGPIEWGRRMVKGLPLGADAKMLAFENVEPLLKTIDQKWAALKGQAVQFLLDEIRAGSQAQSGVALKLKLYPYDTWIGSVEEQFSKSIAKIVRIALKILGQWPTARGRKIEVKTDWGSRFPEDVEARLKLSEARVGLYGRIPAVLDREAKADGYTPEERKEILAAAERKGEADMLTQEANAQGGGMLGARKALEMRTQKQLPAPSQNIASPKVGQPPEV